MYLRPDKKWNEVKIMNMNGAIDLSGISTDNVYRIRRSKKNGKLISYNEYGKVIIIKNWKSLHVG